MRRATTLALLWGALLVISAVPVTFPVAGIEGFLSQSVDAKWARVNWEAEAEPLRMIVIHHTAAPPGMIWQKLSEVERGRIYEAHWKTGGKDPVVQGLPVHSGHYRIVAGKKVEHFCTYHWIVRRDGNAERLLWDDERGWHAGNWGVNMRSIGIVLDGDFSTEAPPPAMLATCARLMKAYENREQRALNLSGHTDIKPTVCPGSWWVDKKSELLNLVPDAEPYPIAFDAP